MYSVSACQISNGFESRSAVSSEAMDDVKGSAPPVGGRQHRGSNSMTSRVESVRVTGDFVIGFPPK
jgi:hypothetical protein